MLGLVAAGRDIPTATTTRLVQIRARMKRMLGRRGGASPAAGSAAVEANPRKARIAVIDLVTALPFGAPQAGRPVRADGFSRRWSASPRACCDPRRDILATRRLGPRQFSGCLGGKFFFSPISARTSSSGTGGKSFSCVLPGLGSLQPPEPRQSASLLLPCRHLPTWGPAKRYPSVPMVKNGQHGVYPSKHRRFSHSGGSAE